MRKRIVRITVSCLIAFVAALIYQPTLGQYIYYSNYPGQCENVWPFSDSSAVFVHAPGYSDITGARFRLDADYFGPEDVVYLMSIPGVIIEDGDLFQGMTLSWTPLELNHYQLLKLSVVNDPPYQEIEFGGFIIKEAVLYRVGGDSLFLDDCWTHAGHADCWYASFGCWHPDTVDVVIGSQSTVEIKCWISVPGYGGTSFEITDIMDWVTDWNPKSVWHDGCGVCQWEEATVLISIMVSESTPAQTLSKLTIRPTYAVVSDSTSFFLKAIPPISVKSDTWGGIKALFKKK